MFWPLVGWGVVCEWWGCLLLVVFVGLLGEVLDDFLGVEELFGEGVGGLLVGL